MTHLSDIYLQFNYFSQTKLNTVYFLWNWMMVD